MGTHGSWRRSPLPKNWKQLREAVMTRDGGVCQGYRNRRQCGMPATDVDHINGHDDHRMENLQALCRTCHTRKTQAESIASQRARYTRGKERNPYA